MPAPQCHQMTVFIFHQKIRQPGDQSYQFYCGDPPGEYSDKRDKNYDVIIVIKVTKVAKTYKAYGLDHSKELLETRNKQNWGPCILFQ